MSDIVKGQYLILIFVFQTACHSASQIDKLTVLGHVWCVSCLKKKSIQVQATTEEETGNDAQKRKGTEGEGGSEYSWVSRSDRASMMGM